MNPQTLHAILDAIDAANAEDPHAEIAAGKPQPRALLYGQRMRAWIERLQPDPSPALQIAARAQHIRRWEHPRETYPMDRKGYLSWRRALYAIHAEHAASIMRRFDADPDTIARVSFLLHKKQLHHDPDTQALEDAACLVFLEFHLAEFAEKTERDKLITILRKTWRKMSDRGHEFALQLPYSPEMQVLLQDALHHG